MGLDYPSEWRFEAVAGAVPDGFHSDAVKLVGRIAVGSDSPKRVYEAIKESFGTGGHSSDAEWAKSDMMDAMRSKKDNVVIYLDSLWNGIGWLEAEEKTPSQEHVNKLLAANDVPLQIVGSSLQLLTGDVTLLDDDDVAECDTASMAFERGELLGRGGFGEVYRVCRNTKAGSFEYAMKVLNPSPFNERPEKAWKRFVREMELLKGLQHRGIVELLEAGKLPDESPYILMPVVEGKDFRRALSGQPLEEVCHAFDLVLEALEYAHGKDVLHRDIRPPNVLVRESDGQPVILDFGCAYLMDQADEEALTTTLVGSRPYVPSEVVSNPTLHSPKQDIYACGIMLYEVLASVRPDPGDYEPLQSGRAEYAPLDGLIRRAIAPARTRIKNVTQFRELLAKVNY